MMACVKCLLKNLLKDLEKDDLKEFQWHLKNEHIAKSEMENADRLKTVDKMVACFGPEEAVKVTMEILKKINQNDLAEQLGKDHKQAQAEGSTANPVLAGATSKPKQAQAEGSTAHPVLAGATSKPKQDRAWDMDILKKGNQLDLWPESRLPPSSLARTGLIGSEMGRRKAEELFRNPDRAMDILKKGNQLDLWPESRLRPSSLTRTGLIESEMGRRKAEELLRNPVTGTDMFPRTRNDIQKYVHKHTLDVKAEHKRISLSEGNTVITRTYKEHLKN